MCGIVGYVGDRDACPIVLKGLKRLEYRGYDSAGVAIVNDKGELNVFKCKGTSSWFSPSVMMTMAFCDSSLGVNERTARLIAEPMAVP